MEKAHEAIAIYFDAFRHRYQCDPLFGKKEAGQIKHLVKNYGLERTKLIIQAYLQMNDWGFEGHPIGMMVTCAPKIYLALQKGTESIKVINARQKDLTAMGIIDDKRILSRTNAKTS